MLDIRICISTEREAVAHLNALLWEKCPYLGGGLDDQLLHLDPPGTEISMLHLQHHLLPIDTAGPKPTSFSAEVPLGCSAQRL